MCEKCSLRFPSTAHVQSESAGSSGSSGKVPSHLLDQSEPDESECAATRPPVLLLPPAELSRGHVEELGRFIGVIDGQADGSDVLQSLHNKIKRA